MSRKLPLGSMKIRMPRRERPRGSLSMNKPLLLRSVRKDQGLLLDEVVADLVVDLDVRPENLLRGLLDTRHNDVTVGYRKVGRGVVVGPVFLAQRFIGVEPGRLPVLSG